MQGDVQDFFSVPSLSLLDVKKPRRHYFGQAVIVSLFCQQTWQSWVFQDASTSIFGLRLPCIPQPTGHSRQSASLMWKLGIPFSGQGACNIMLESPSLCPLQMVPLIITWYSDPICGLEFPLDWARNPYCFDMHQQRNNDVYTGTRLQTSKLGHYICPLKAMIEIPILTWASILNDYLPKKH